MKYEKFRISLAYTVISNLNNTNCYISIHYYHLAVLFIGITCIMIFRRKLFQVISLDSSINRHGTQNLKKFLSFTHGQKSVN